LKNRKLFQTFVSFVSYLKTSGFNGQRRERKRGLFNIFIFLFLFLFHFLSLFHFLLISSNIKFTKNNQSRSFSSSFSLSSSSDSNQHINKIMEKQDQNQTYYTFTFAEPSSQAETIGLIFYIVVYGLILSCFLTLLMLRRKTRILSTRCPPVLFVAHVYAYLCACLIVASFIQGKPKFCGALSALHTTYVPMTVLPFFLLFVDLVFTADLNNLKLNRQEGGDNWRWKWKKILSVKARFCIIFVGCLAQVVVFLIVYYKVPDENLPGDCVRKAVVVGVSFLLLYFLVLGYCLHRMIRIKDPYFLRPELIGGLVILSPSTFFIIVYPIHPQFFWETFDYRWIVLSVAFLSIFNNLVFPVLCSFEKVENFLLRHTTKYVDPLQLQAIDTKGIIFALNEGLDVFDAVLKNPILMRAFINFTVQNWSVENVLFYQKIEEYKEAVEDHNMKEKAKFIYQEFLVFGSPLEVNLDKKISQDVQGKIEKNQYERDLFNEAQVSIYELMKKDSFGKFKKTPEFQEALKRAVREGSSFRSSSLAHE